jgi:vacuolar-type H+-ATPase subunit E/Vma4
MSLRRLAQASALVVIVFCGNAHAQESDSLTEINRIQSLLAVINSELKSDLDQILLLQEAIKANARAPLEVQGRTPDAVSYEEVAAGQRRAIQREAAINARLDTILSRSAALDAAKQILLERIRELSQAPAANATLPRR